MTTPGYPDYQRLSLGGGVQLASVAGNIASGTQIFAGYIGLWPFMNIFVDSNISGNIAQIEIDYWTGSAGGASAGLRRLVRIDGQFSFSSYANIAQYATITVTTSDGNPFNVSVIQVYGAMAYGPPVGINSTDVPIIDANVSVAATSTTNLFTVRTQPGDATFLIQTAAVSWTCNLLRYDFASKTYVLRWQINQTMAIQGGSFNVPMLDCPYRIDLHNGDAAAKTFLLMWLNK